MIPLYRPEKILHSILSIHTLQSILDVLGFAQWDEYIKEVRDMSERSLLNTGLLNRNIFTTYQNSNLNAKSKIDFI